MDIYKLLFPSVTLLCLWDTTVQSEGNGVATEYCQGGSFSPQCNSDEVIVMQSANYGSLRIGQCLKEDPFDQVGCSVDVLAVTDEKCSGRRKCDVRVPNNEMDDLRTCKHDFTRYLEAAYWCRTVHRPQQQSCSRATTITSTKSGYIASIVTLETNCGLTESPWILEAKEGQKINLTLTYFNWWRHDETGEDESTCTGKLGYLFDLSSEDIVNICGGKSRVAHLYMSQGHQLQLLLDRAVLTDNHFVIKYQAVGCPLMSLPENTWSEMSGDVMTVGCTNGPEEWSLKCRGSHWIGIMQSCSAPKSTDQVPVVKSPQSVKDVYTTPEDHKLYFTVIIVIGGVTVIACLIVIVSGVICIKRMNIISRKYKDDTKTGNYLPMKNTDGHNNPFQTQTTQPPPTGGHCEWQNGTLLSNNSGGTESAQYFILDKEYMDNMYTLQARK